MAGSAMVALALKALLTLFGVVDLDDTQIERAASAIIDLVFVVGLVIGQMRRKDLILGFKRK